MPTLRILVTGLIGQHPQLGGMTWHYLQYVLGLARLGHDVHYLEDSGEWPYNLDGGLSGANYQPETCDANLNYLQRVMSRFGLEGRWAYRCPIDSTWYGLPEARVEELLESADLLINVSGTLADPSQYRNVPRLAYIDTDPVFTQIKLLRGEGRFRSALEAHDVLFSFGLCLPGVLPPTGHTWIPTRQPVVLDEWRPAGSHRGVYTTVMNWASYDPERFNEGSFGQKDIEFAKFLDLPHQVKPARLEIAVRGMRNGTLPGASSSRKPADLIDTLRARGWGVVDATKVCATFEDYREHIRHSKAEWSIAKNAYVEGKAGWFSDRSACYLAAGRPVVVQDTGFGSVLPMGEGLLSFSTVREAVEATQSVERDYNRHCRAARRVAEEYFDSAAVLSTLIEQAFRSDTVEPHRQERSLC